MTLKETTIEVEGRQIKLTNLDRVLFPDTGVTKGDVVAHYRDVADIMVPHVRARPVTLQRYHGPVDGPGIYQKEAPAHFPPWIVRVPVHRREDGATLEHPSIEDAASLVYLANQGSVSFHVWPTRAPDLAHPDLVVFDLDPPGDDVVTVRLAARLVRDVLVDRGLVPYVQTTGSKGLHVVVPLDRSASVEQVQTFARAVAGDVAAEHPSRFTVETRKAKRDGRLFLDTGRNGYAQMFVAPYSVRARPGATVATPITWDELSRVEPRRYTVQNLRRRLARKDDPWAQMAADARPLPPAGS